VHEPARYRLFGLGGHWVRDALIPDRPVSVAVGINPAGERDVRGLELGPIGGEGATQWAMVRLT